jgi:hypothetical protein
MSASPSQPTIAHEPSFLYTQDAVDSKAWEIHPDYIDWAVRRYGKQFDRISMERLEPAISSHDRLLAQFVAARDRIESVRNR